MNPVRILMGVVVAGATAIAALALASSSTAHGVRGNAQAAFDPLFAPGALCAPARAGRPPLLGQLVLAQAETAPFKPGQVLPSSRRGSAAPDDAPPLYANLGSLHVPVTTASARAQAYFDQGLRLSFAFNHAEAVRAFRAARQHDPGCAMCHWGEALALGWNIPAREIVQTARAVARGRLLDARGDLPGAIGAYREAIALQDGLPYMEPPYWYYPVRQSLGAALLRSGQLDVAEQVFRDSLARTPSNGWALRGLIEVYRERGDEPALAAARKRFATTWLGAPDGPPLARL